MSTGLIIAIVVIALLLIALLVMLPRLRRKAQVRKRERELGQRREARAGEHRQVADTRAREAERAEREARIAEKEAQRQRAEAELHQERATMHERGDADHELIEEHERDRFAATSAGTDTDDTARTDEPRMDRDATMGRDTATTGSQNEFEQGREVGHEEERRIRREDQPADSGSRRP